MFARLVDSRRCISIILIPLFVLIYSNFSFAGDSINIDILPQSSTLTIITSDLPEWTVGKSFNHQLLASGGTGLLLWSDSNGDLVGTGLALSASGLLFGIPINAETITFTAQVSDTAGNYADRNLSLVINPHVIILTEELPQWTIGCPYSYTISADGGTSPLLWNDLNGTFYCGGLHFDSTGHIYGTPTVVTTKHFSVQVIDGAGDFDTGSLTIIINPAVNILTSDLPDGKEGKPYSLQLEAAGGTGDITYSDLNGELLGTGLSISPQGIISGIPDLNGILFFVIRATDLAGSHDDSFYAFQISPDFVCGDANNDDKVNLLDIGYIINFLYRGGGMPDPWQSADADGNGNINLLDVSYIIRNLYFSGPPLHCPD
jgi:hypothetical protein